MGLDVSHDAFSGAYSSFNRFRQTVCKAAGGSFPPHDDPTLDQGYWHTGEHYTREAYPGLFEFLGHSDCDGEISPEMCTKVAFELEALLPKIIEIAPDEPGGHLARQGGYGQVTLNFIKGCREAAAANEPLIFQ